MSQTREFLLDPLFTSRFFHVENEKKLPVLPFPLPEAIELLPSFLKWTKETVEPLDDEMQRSKQFKEGFSDIVDQLYAWCEKSNIEPSSCARFKDIYMGYSGTDVDNNLRTFRIYNQGITWLAGIVQEINNEKILPDDCRSIIKNLLSDINVCGPGGFTHILHAYLDLVALSSSSIYWVVLRRKIAGQVVLAFLENSNVQKGFYIHYVNAVLNRYSDSLGISMVEDSYIAACKPILDDFIRLFVEKIQSQLTLDGIIYEASGASTLPNLKTKFELDLGSLVKREAYTANVEDMESRMKRVGVEAADKQFFTSIKDILRFYGELDDQVAVYWGAPYKIFLSIYSRMQCAGLIDLNEKESYVQINSNVKLWYLKDRSLQFAYVNEEKNQQVSAIPLIVYLVEKLMGKDEKISSKESDAIFTCLQASNMFATKNRNEIIAGIFEYLGSTLEMDREKTGNDWKRIDDLIVSLNLINDFEGLLLIVKNLPSKLRVRFLLANKGLVINLIQTADQLAAIVSKFPDDVAISFLASIKDHLIKLSSDGFQLAKVVGPLTENEDGPFLVLIDSHLKTIIQDDRQLVAVLKRLRVTGYRPFFWRIQSDDLHRLMPDADKLVKVILGLAGIDKAQETFVVLIKDYLIKILSVGDRLGDTVMKLPEDQRKPFLGLIEKYLVEIIPLNKFAKVVLNLSNDMRKPFVILIQDYIIKYVWNGNELVRAMSGLSHSECKLFFELMEPYLVRMIRTGYQLVDVAKTLSDSDRKAFYISILGHVVKLISDHHNLAAVVGCLPSHERSSFLALILILDRDIKTITSSFQLSEIINILPNNERMPFLVLIRNQLLGIIHNGSDVAMIVAALADEEGKTFVALLGKKKIISGFNELKKVVRDIPVEWIAPFLSSIQGYEIGFIGPIEELTATAKELPDDRRAPLLGFLVSYLGKSVDELRSPLMQYVPQADRIKLLCNALSNVSTVTNVNKVLTIFNEMRTSDNDQTMHQAVVTELCKKTNVSLLEVATRHSFFGELKRQEKTGWLVDSREVLRKRREELNLSASTIKR